MVVIKIQEVSLEIIIENTFYIEHQYPQQSEWRKDIDYPVLAWLSSRKRGDSITSSES